MSRTTAKPKGKRASVPESFSHSQSHPLTFGPLTLRAILGMLWMKLTFRQPIILVGVRTKAVGEWKARTRRVFTEITASSMKCESRRALARKLNEEAQKRAEEK